VTPQFLILESDKLMPRQASTLEGARQIFDASFQFSGMVASWQLIAFLIPSTFHQNLGFHQ
jgi:hypothetical protein